jgi:hypothetical protein
VLAVLSSHPQSELTAADWFVASLEQVTAVPQSDGNLRVRLETIDIPPH